MMGLTTWMKKYLVFAQIWIMCFSMEANVVGYFLGRNVLVFLNGRWVVQQC